jgi:hypothetical protein
MAKESVGAARDGNLSRRVFVFAASLLAASLAGLPVSVKKKIG